MLSSSLLLLHCVRVVMGGNSLPVLAVQLLPPRGELPEAKESGFWSSLTGLPIPTSPRQRLLSVQCVSYCNAQSIFIRWKRLSPLEALFLLCVLRLTPSDIGHVRPAPQHWLILSCPPFLSLARLVFSSGGRAPQCNVSLLTCGRSGGWCPTAWA